MDSNRRHTDARLLNRRAEAELRHQFPKSTFNRIVAGTGRDIVRSTLVPRRRRLQISIGLCITIGALTGLGLGVAFWLWLGTR